MAAALGGGRRQAAAQQRRLGAARAAGSGRMDLNREEDKGRDGIGAGGGGDVGDEGSEI